MLNNFQLTAIAKTSRHLNLFRIPLHQRLQNTLADSWEQQYNTFIRDIHEINFNAGYNPETHEKFSISNYQLPDWLRDRNSQTILSLDPINSDERNIDGIKSIVGFAQNENTDEIILFQNFTNSCVIRPGRFLFLEHGTYDTTQSPGLTLGVKLCALYIIEERKLLFHNFRTVNTFLPLADYYEEASEQEIRDVLNHSIFAPEDTDALAVGANQWFRKRFAMLRDSRILDQYTTQEILDRSHGYDVNIQVNEDRIIFPAEKGAAKRLLQFLNEEIYRGAITDRLYETNSKRETD